MTVPGARTCQLCGCPIDKSSQFDFCPSCLGAMKERVAPAPEPEKPSLQWKPWALGGLLAACAAVIVLRIPHVRAALAVLHPPAPQAGDPADLCLANLWHVSALIQEGRWPSDEVDCPLTRAPYRTRDDGKDLTVSCPNAGAHGFKSLRVSRSQPAPEAVPSGPAVQ